MVENSHVFADLWSYFVEMKNANPKNPLTYSEILAWCQLSRVGLSPLEVQLIKRIDAAFNSYEAK